MNTRSDHELLQEMRAHLFTAIIGDVLDLHGYHHQFLMPECRPLHPGMVVCGRAMTVFEVDIAEPVDPPFGLMLKALDSMKQDEVYVASGSSATYALWGELMSTSARVRGAAGAVLAGFTRDTHAILEMNFPVFCYGSYAKDQKGRGCVADFRIPLEIHGVKVKPGDIVFGDIDGVVILPQEIESDVVAQAMEQVKKEKTAKRLLLSGASAEDVFGETGVL
ncbi:MAG: RraA family protein [Acidobacteriaceae bacterium]